MQVEIFAAGEKEKGKRGKNTIKPTEQNRNNKQENDSTIRSKPPKRKKKKENQKIKNLLFENQKIPEQKRIYLL